MKTLTALILTGGALAAAAGIPAFAGDHDDDERARDAVRRAEVLPLAEILPAVEARLGGRVIEVEFERDDGRYLYEFELITPDGRILEAEVDAASGALLNSEEDDD